MKIRETLLALLFALAFTLVVAGVWAMHAPAGLIAAGLAVGVWSWLVLSE